MISDSFFTRRKNACMSVAFTFYLSVRCDPLPINFEETFYILATLSSKIFILRIIYPYVTFYSYSNFCCVNFRSSTWPLEFIFFSRQTHQTFTTHMSKCLLIISMMCWCVRTKMNISILDITKLCSLSGQYNIL